MPAGDNPEYDEIHLCPYMTHAPSALFISVYYIETGSLRVIGLLIGGAS